MGDANKFEAASGRTIICILVHYWPKWTELYTQSKWRARKETINRHKTVYSLDLGCHFYYNQFLLTHHSRSETHTFFYSHTLLSACTFTRTGTVRPTASAPYMDAKCLCDWNQIIKWKKKERPKIVAFTILPQPQRVPSNLEARKENKELVEGMFSQRTIMGFHLTSLVIVKRTL